MNISNKKLKKALDLYQSGDYEAALKICEKFLEKEYSNEEALSLEGDILYKLGRIDDAIVTWKINSEYNNNEEANNRLAVVDKERKEQALSYTNIQNMSSEDRLLLENAYRENIELKKQVEESSMLNPDKANPNNSNDNNTNENLEKKSDSEINIESKTPTADLQTDEEKMFANIVKENTDSESQPIVDKEYTIIETNIDEMIESEPKKDDELEPIDLEDFKNRIKHLEENENSNDEDFNLNSSASKASNTEENVKVEAAPITKEPKAPKSSSGTKKKAIIAAIAVIAVIVVAVSYSKLSSSSKHNSSTDISTNKDAATNKPSTDSNVAKPTTQTSTAVLTPEQATKYTNDVNYLISANSIDGIAKLLESTPKTEIPASAMPAYEKAENFMNTTGLTYYYNNGMNAYSNNDYSTAIEYFNKAKPFAKNDFRGPTMLFLTAASYEKLGDLNDAVNTYKDFIQTYPDAQSYGPESLYFLANYYSTHNDPTSAKQYAKELQSKYPDSMYNNSNIAKILK
ncbi:MAG: tetratricopeptide repeat protein [Sarcina sp.]